MGSFVKAQKSHQRLHRERVNVLDKGFLERKQDYKARAAENNRRKEIFTKLRKKVLDKNPDEFFFRMKSSNLIDGIHYDHRKDNEDDEICKDEQKLMLTQDLNYINYRRSIDLKKIEKLKQELIDPSKLKHKNKHIFFVDDNTEDLNIETKLTKPSSSNDDEEMMKQLSNEIKDLKYRRLKNKLNREQLLRAVSKRMQLKKHLSNRNESKAIKIKMGKNGKLPVYQWKMERKK